MGRGKTALQAVGATTTAIGAVLLYVVVLAPRHVDREVSSVLRSAKSPLAVDVTHIELGQEVAEEKASLRQDFIFHDATDGVRHNNRLHVTAGHGVFVFDDGQEKPRTLFAEHNVSALAVFQGALVVGTRDGKLFVHKEGSAQQLVIEAPTRSAPITALIADDSTLLIATAGGGLQSWNGTHATVWPHDGGHPLGNVTAIARSGARFAYGTQDGTVVFAEDNLFSPRNQDEQHQRITALAWQGDTLWVGRPFSLETLQPYQGKILRRVVRDNLNITSLLFDEREQTMYIGTSDRGLFAIDSKGHEAHYGGKLRIRRLRTIEGRPALFGSGGAWTIRDRALSTLLPHKAGVDPDSRL